MTTERYTTAIEAKMAREAKANPTHWIIAPKGTLQRPRYDLEHIGDVYDVRVEARRELAARGVIEGGPDHA